MYEGQRPQEEYTDLNEITDVSGEEVLLKEVRKFFRDGSISALYAQTPGNELRLQTLTQAANKLAELITNARVELSRCEADPAMRFSDSTFDIRKSIAAYGNAIQYAQYLQKNANTREEDGDTPLHRFFKEVSKLEAIAPAQKYTIKEHELLRQPPVDEGDDSDETLFTTSTTAVSTKPAQQAVIPPIDKIMRSRKAVADFGISPATDVIDGKDETTPALARQTSLARAAELARNGDDLKNNSELISFSEDAINDNANIDEDAPLVIDAPAAIQTRVGVTPVETTPPQFEEVEGPTEEVVKESERKRSRAAWTIAQLGLADYSQSAVREYAKQTTIFADAFVAGHDPIESMKPEIAGTHQHILREYITRLLYGLVSTYPFLRSEKALNKYDSSIVRYAEQLVDYIRPKVLERIESYVAHNNFTMQTVPLKTIVEIDMLITAECLVDAVKSIGAMGLTESKIDPVAYFFSKVIRHDFITIAKQLQELEIDSHQLPSEQSESLEQDAGVLSDMFNSGDVSQSGERELENNEQIDSRVGGSFHRLMIESKKLLLTNQFLKDQRSKDKLAVRQFIDTLTNNQRATKLLTFAVETLSDDQEVLFRERITIDAMVPDLEDICNNTSDIFDVLTKFSAYFAGIETRLRSTKSEDMDENLTRQLADTYHQLRLRFLNLRSNV